MRYPDLIDHCIEAEESSGQAGNAVELFRCALSDYFFREETDTSKGFAAFLEKFEMPAFLGKYRSLFEVDIEELRAYVDNETINGSLCGKLFLSAHYLKSFYPHQPPSFNQLSPDVRAEVLNKIKETNREIVEAFEKMKADAEADRNRKILAVVANALKNVHKATEFPLNRLERKAQDIIKEIFPSADDIYTANPRQSAELADDGRTKDLVKAFFAIRKFQDITEISGYFRKELDRYRKRTLRARQ
ncbi:MAG TPA: hypothetical protein PKY31_13940 [Spirochaetota bacterium]|nr:hypothetical protein [Spirochaetota bacterium]